MSRDVPEWKAKHDDQAIPRTVKDRILLRAERKCAICGDLVTSANFDHIVALCNGGEHRESNLQLLHVSCHKTKSKADRATQAKDRRVRTKHHGIKKPRTMTAWRKFSGEIVHAKRDR